MDIEDCTHGDGCPVHPDVHAVHNFDAEHAARLPRRPGRGYQGKIDSLTARMAAALVQLRHLRAEVSVVTVVRGHDDRSRFRENIDKITETLTLPAAPSTTPAETDAEYDARREAERPDPLNVVRGIVAGYVPNGEESYAIAMRCLRELDAQRHTTPAEARTGISDRTAAALSAVDDLRREVGRCVNNGAMGPGYRSHLDIIERALRADGAA